MPTTSSGLNMAPQASAGDSLAGVLEHGAVDHLLHGLRVAPAFLVGRLVVAHHGDAGAYPRPGRGNPWPEAWPPSRRRLNPSPPVRRKERRSSVERERALWAWLSMARILPSVGIRLVVSGAFGVRRFLGRFPQRQFFEILDAAFIIPIERANMLEGQRSFGRENVGARDAPRF